MLKESIFDKVKNCKNPYNKDEVNIIVSGRIREEKGQDFILKSFKKIVESIPKIKLNIIGDIGDIDYYNKLQKIIIEQDIDSYIQFLGFKENPYPYYKYADLLSQKGASEIILGRELNIPKTISYLAEYYKAAIGTKVEEFFTLTEENKRSILEKLLDGKI